MNIDFNNLEVQRKINKIAELCKYGIEWNRNIGSSSYVVGGVETTAHIVSCCICQWFNVANGVGTAETRDHLQMTQASESQKVVTIKQWENRIKKFLKVL